jgi:anaerobic ribonucleoside-triphosphate reductase activating protein
MILEIAAVKRGSAVNGPGRRQVVWTQGCSLRCAGCFNKQLQRFGAGARVEPELLAERLASECGGLTVSGGEPFDQSEAVYELIRRYKEKSGGTVIVFSGYEPKELTSSAAKRKTLLAADAVVSGRYAPGEVWGNKRLLLVSGRITADEMKPGACVEMSVAGGEIFVSGYPAFY